VERDGKLILESTDGHLFYKGEHYFVDENAMPMVRQQIKQSTSTKYPIQREGYSKCTHEISTSSTNTTQHQHAAPIDDSALRDLWLDSDTRLHTIHFTCRTETEKCCALQCCWLARSTSNDMTVFGMIILYVMILGVL
jgi:hypothetical protein